MVGQKFRSALSTGPLTSGNMRALVVMLVGACRDRWGEGLETEAARLLLAFGSTTLGCIESGQPAIQTTVHRLACWRRSGCRTKVASAITYSSRAHGETRSRTPSSNPSGERNKAP